MMIYHTFKCFACNRSFWKYIQMPKQLTWLRDHRQMAMFYDDDHDYQDEDDQYYYIDDGHHDHG